jgi:hypothetical protein
MEPECLLLLLKVRSQQHAIGSSPEPVHILTSYIFKIHFNIIILNLCLSFPSIYP